MIEGIIFDLDGVIVHTDQFHYQGWKRLADRMGIYFDETINHRLRGVSRMDSLEILLERYEGPELSMEEKAALAEEKNGYYRELLGTMTEKDVEPEVLETLRELRARGKKLAIGSSSKNAGFILERVGLLDFFDAISDGNNITRSKPDPEVFIKAAQLLGVPAERCLVVEDAVAGIQAARAGGMYAAAIGDAKMCGAADYRLDRFGDLLFL